MSFWHRTSALRWWIIGIVMLGTMLNYLTRSTLAVAAPSFMVDLHINEQQYSYITAAFQGGIMLQPVVGYILDVVGLRSGMALFAAGWGLLSMAHGLAFSWQWLFALRGMLGFAEGTSHTGGLKVVSEWFPARERGFAGGIYNLGASAGAALAAPLVAGSIALWNWRAAFVVTGVLALLWALLWLVNYRTPQTHPSISEQERDLILSGQEAHIQERAERPSPLRLLTQRNFWGIALPRFLADPTWGTLTFWMPLYLVKVRGFNLGEIAVSAFLPFIAADLGCMFGPALALFLQRRGISLINARRWTFTFGALLMTGMVFVASVENAWAAVALLCLGGFAHQTLSVTVITMATDLFPRNELGTVAGLAGTFANGSILIFTLLIGGLVASLGYGPFFIALGLLDLVAALLLWTLVKAPR
ncbi:MFS transporter [Sphingomonas trueperi]|jgi:ACS family hexuronate transporter-like MFS transporter|uniref:MFS transporter n=1 Tax=Sphingomonas trueperi TaxID=53317 RepID=UPI000EAE4673